LGKARSLQQQVLSFLFCGFLNKAGKGEVYSWGTNTRGELGHSPGKQSCMVPTAVPLSSIATEVIAGRYHCLCLTGTRQKTKKNLNFFFAKVYFIFGPNKFWVLILTCVRERLVELGFESIWTAGCWFQLCVHP
jgi:hypothetical protein